MVDRVIWFPYTTSCYEGVSILDLLELADDGFAIHTQMGLVHILHCKYGNISYNIPSLFKYSSVTLYVIHVVLCGCKRTHTY